jgi:hypothetical protein
VFGSSTTTELFGGTEIVNMTLAPFRVQLEPTRPSGVSIEAAVWSVELAAGVET